MGDSVNTFEVTSNKEKNKQGPTISMNESQIYIRCKRRHQTIFLNVSPSETIQSIKKKLSTSLSGEPSWDDMQVYVEDRSDPLPDKATISDHDIANDDVLYLAFRKNYLDEDYDESCWEDIEV